MKNFAKFLLFVLLVSAGISLLYDYRLKHGGLNLPSGRKPEKYTLASNPSVDPKQVPSLEALNRERRALVKSVIPSVVAVKTSRKVSVRRENELDPFEFFFRNRRQFRSPRDETLVQNSLGSGVIVTNEGHIITNSHVVTDREGNQVDQIEVQLSDGQTKKARLVGADSERSEEHTSELQSPCNLVCRLLLEKKKKYAHRHPLYSSNPTDLPLAFVVPAQPYAASLHSAHFP